MATKRKPGTGQPTIEGSKGRNLSRNHAGILLLAYPLQTHALLGFLDNTGKTIFLENDATHRRLVLSSINSQDEPHRRA